VEASVVAGVEKVVAFDYGGRRPKYPDHGNLPFAVQEGATWEITETRGESRHTGAEEVTSDWRLVTRQNARDRARLPVASGAFVPRVSGAVRREGLFLTVNCQQSTFMLDVSCSETTTRLVFRSDRSQAAGECNRGAFGRRAGAFCVPSAAPQLALGDLPQLIVEAGKERVLRIGIALRMHRKILWRFRQSAVPRVPSIVVCA
jgi:hypothetical protein